MFVLHADEKVDSFWDLNGPTTVDRSRTSVHQWSRLGNHSWFIGHPQVRCNKLLLNLRSDLTVDVLQRDRVNACQLYLIEGYRESLVVHQV